MSSDWNSLIRRVSNYIYKLTFSPMYLNPTNRLISLKVKYSYLNWICMCERKQKMYRWATRFSSLYSNKNSSLCDKRLTQIPDYIIRIFFDYWFPPLLLILLHHPLRDCSDNYNALWLSTTREASLIDRYIAISSRWPVIFLWAFDHL